MFKTALVGCAAVFGIIYPYFKVGEKLKFYGKIANMLYLMAALNLITLALLIMLWSLYEAFKPLKIFKFSINVLLDSVGAIIIAIAVLDLSKYLIEEEVFRNKELRSPGEARGTVTKLFVITSIATGMEGIVYIFKSGTQDDFIGLCRIAYFFVLDFNCLSGIVSALKCNGRKDGTKSTKRPRHSIKF